MGESPERREETMEANLTGSFGHDLDPRLELTQLLNRRKQPGTEFDAWLIFYSRVAKAIHIK